MITSLKIQNFQSHKDTLLEFDPGVNVIVGSTDSGKSSIIRAIRWCKDNRPQGNEFRSWWGGVTLSKITTPEGSVTRLKGKKDKYIVIDSEGKVLKLEAFRATIPEEVSELLNISEVNLQRQLDSPFLLSKTPGEVAIYFNKIAKIDKINKGQQNTQKWTRALESDIAHTRSQIVQSKKDLEGFVYLDKLEIEVEALERLENKSRRLWTATTKLEDLIDTFEKVQESLKTWERYTDIAKELNIVCLQVIRRDKKEEACKRLQYLIESYESYQKRTDRRKRIIKAEPTVQELIKLQQDKKSNEALQSNLEKAVNTLSSVTIQLTKAEDDYIRLSKAFKKAFPDICPLCGNKVKKR